MTTEPQIITNRQFCFENLSFGHSRLFRISDFVLRILTQKRFYSAKWRCSTVMTLIMQNKPNLPNAQMNVTLYLTNTYENQRFADFKLFYAKRTQFMPFFAQKQRFRSKTNPKQTQNKPKTTPKQTQFFGFCTVFLLFNL